MTTSLADDILTGPAAIAAFTGFSEHQVRHFIRKGAMPAFRAGSRIMARKSSIMNWVAPQEAPALPRGAVNDNGPLEADAPPYRVGEEMDDGIFVQSVQRLTESVWFIGIEGHGFIWMSPETVSRIPEPWFSRSPYVQTWKSTPDGWIDWELPTPRRRRKAA